jgi:hypothetical protein
MTTDPNLVKETLHDAEEHMKTSCPSLISARIAAGPVRPLWALM